MEIETRSLPADLSTSDGLKVTGYAAVFNSYSQTMPAAAYDYEIVELGAFDNADFSRCVFRYNHSDHDQLLARVSNNTLKLSVDDHGLKVEADIADTTLGRDVYKLIERRDIAGMSFGFIVAESYIEYRVRHITKIKSVLDVSAVDDPAYTATSLDVVKRSIRAAKEKEDAEKRKRLHIQCIEK